MTRDVRAVIDLTALRHNLRMVRTIAPGSRVMAVVKANGYGHGLREVAKALVSADAFAVSCLDEALALREAGLLHPIVMLEGFFDSDELRAITAHRLDIVVHAAWQIEVLESCRLTRPLRVWVKVDSGMRRIGFQPEQVAAVLARLRASGVVREIRLLTHLACADDRDSDYTLRQLETFNQVSAGLSLERSIANSAGLLAWPAAHAEWVRPGIMLYGASPFADGRGEHPELQPVMTLSSRLIAIQQFRRGDTVGYAGSFVCPEDMPVGVVAAGYGDGYPRHGSNGAPILVNGRRTVVLGRVSMDMLCVDLRGFEAVQVNDPVTLWGKGLPVEEVAAASGTISYELLCRLTRRVRFEYRDPNVQS
jgi:alanine racemase